MHSARRTGTATGRGFAECRGGAGHRRPRSRFCRRCPLRRRRDRLRCWSAAAGAVAQITSGSLREFAPCQFNCNASPAARSDSVRGRHLQPRAADRGQQRQPDHRRHHQRRGQRRCGYGDRADRLHRLRGRSGLGLCHWLQDLECHRGGAQGGRHSAGRDPE